jgi:flagellar hook-basal body complex protein FliE
MDPLTTGIAAFNAIKMGVRAGKEIHSLGKEIGSLFDAIDDSRKTHEKKKRRSILTPNEEAMETFMAKKKAEDMEIQLREIIINSRGLSAWQELLQIRRDIRIQRKEAERQAKKEQQEKIEAIAIGATIFIAAIAVIGVVYLIYLRSKGDI